MDLEPTSTEFLHWLDGRGVQINGVSAAFMQGKGRGIVATKQIKVGQSHILTCDFTEKMC